MGVYTKKMYMNIRNILIMQYGEVDGRFLYQLQKKVMDMANSDKCDLDEYEKACLRYNNAIKKAIDKEAAEKSGNLEVLKKIYCNAFGEKDSELLAKYMIRLTKIEYDGLNNENVDEYREILGKYNQLLNSLGGIKKLINNYYGESENDTLHECYSDYDLDTEFESLKSNYCTAFGKKDGELLAKYMLRISQINNIEGKNDSNSTEYE